jgi:serine/threonine protein kinase
LYIFSGYSLLQPMIGKVILNYEIKALIGEGGMGAVYLAQHTQVSRRVAIKVLLPQYLKNQEIRQRFKNEASMMAHLQHPNIVSLYDYVEDDSGLYLIMEFVEGTPLDEYIAKVTGPMPEMKAIPIIKQILEAFSYAHSQKVVHRDIKPANILVGVDGKVKILDFGIARIIGEGGHNLTKTGTQMGTVFYMSPEQVQGKKVDHRSDIYSLGVTFYQMVTGINPYKGITTEYEVYSKIVNDSLPNPKEIYPGVPDYLIPILNKALSKNPDDRFADCNGFLQAIENRTLAGYSMPNQNRAKPSSSSRLQSASDSSGTGSLVLGILALIFSFVPFVNLLSLVLGVIAIVTGNKGRSSQSNAGKVLGVVALIISIIILFASLYMIYFKDTDGDRVPDRRDECPWIKGTLHGCPDSDSDGVKNSEDACPYLAGEKSHFGCPDSDGDRIYDNKDKCANEEGPLENNGCPWPDSDDDGIPDKDDQCPYESGLIDNNGCPYQDIDYGYENEAESYTTYCPFCGAVWYLDEYDKMWQCSNCYKDFFNCYKSNGEYGAIKGNWVRDGGCDCNNCTDE